MSKDEIGQLAEAHQVMLSGITSVISRLQQVNQNLKLSEERWQLALEGAKGLLGSKPDLRRQRVRSYYDVLRSGLRPAGY